MRKRRTRSNITGVITVEEETVSSVCSVDVIEPADRKEMKIKIAVPDQLKEPESATPGFLLQSAPRIMRYSGHEAEWDCQNVANQESGKSVNLQIKATAQIGFEKALNASSSEREKDSEAMEVGQNRNIKSSLSLSSAHTSGKEVISVRPSPMVKEIGSFTTYQPFLSTIGSSSSDGERVLSNRMRTNSCEKEMMSRFGYNPGTDSFTSRSISQYSSPRKGLHPVGQSNLLKAERRTYRYNEDKKPLVARTTNCLTKNIHTVNSLSLPPSLSPSLPNTIELDNVPSPPQLILGISSLSSRDANSPPLAPTGGEPVNFLSSTYLTEINALSQQDRGDQKEKPIKQAKERFRPPPITTYKESDQFTLLAMRKEYPLLIQDFSSTHEIAGLKSIFNYKYLMQPDDPLPNRKTIIIHPFSLSCSGSTILVKKAKDTALNNSIELKKNGGNNGNGNVSIEEVDERLSQNIGSVFFNTIADASSSKDSSANNSRKSSPLNIPNSNNSSEHDLRAAMNAANEVQRTTDFPAFIDVSASTSVYYLTHNMSMVPTGSTKCKAYPPIRREFQQDALWDAINDNSIFVTSGHMPVDPVLRDKSRGDFYRSMAGINSMEFFLPAFLTESMRRAAQDKTEKGAGYDNFDANPMKQPQVPVKNLMKKVLKSLPQVLCVEPSKLLGINEIKGSIAVGMDADFCIFDPFASFTVKKEVKPNSPVNNMANKIDDASSVGQNIEEGTTTDGTRETYSKYKGGLYDGAKMQGVVKQTYVRGRLVFDMGKFDGVCQGKILERL